MLRLGSAMAGAVSVLMFIHPSVPAVALTATEYESKIATKINQIRVIHGKSRLHRGECVDNVAERWARAVRARQILVHQEMLYVTNKCNAKAAGEILGMGKVTPRQMIRLWMESRDHRAVILKGRYNRIGVGAVRDADGYWWVAVDFLHK